jgi:ABC-2 type transport system permease protein
VKALVIAGTNLRRMFRERSTIFFVIVLPMLIILLLGAAFGGRFTPEVGVVATGSGQLGEELAAALDANEDVDVKRYEAEDELLTAVERGNVQAGLIVPAGYDGALRAGGQAALRYLARPDQLGQQLRSAVDAAVAEQAGVLRAARFAERLGLVSFEVGLAASERVGPALPAATVEAETAGEALYPEDVGQFDLGAAQELILFVFLTSLTGAIALIETRRLGLSRRMLGTPTPTGTVVLGEGLGRFAIALAQGLIIMVATALVFSVGWGDPLAAGVTLLVFCLVGAGAGMLLGATLTNDQQAVAVSLLLGLGLAALGGSMVPLEIFPDTVRTVAHVTPHAWANDAFAELIRRDGGLGDILLELGVLAAYAACLLALASWRLRRVITA